MICTIFKQQEEKLKLMTHTNMTFINQSANFKSSTLSDHITTYGHKRAAKEKNHKDAIPAGRMKMSQDVKILSKVLLNISLNKIYTVDLSELTS